MFNDDLFVGIVAMTVGGFIFASAVFNWDWYYELHKAKWIQWLCGRLGARIFFAFIGFALILLGAAIACGLLPRNGLFSKATSALTRPTNLMASFAESSSVVD